MEICEKEKKPLSWWNSLNPDEQEQAIAWKEYKQERKAKRLQSLYASFEDDKTNGYRAIIKTLITLANELD